MTVEFVHAQARRALRSLGRRAELNRAGLWAICLAISVLGAWMVWDYKRGLAEAKRRDVAAAEQRRDLRDAIRRLERVEQPSLADELRRLERLERLLRSTDPETRARVRRAVRRLVGDTSPPADRRRLERALPPDLGGNRPDDGSAPAPPPLVTPSPGNPSPPSGPPGPGNPPDIRPPPRPPVIIDIPPIDPDGPGGEPPIDPPPIEVPRFDDLPALSP